MKTRFFIFFLSFFFAGFFASAQKVDIIINGDNVENNHIYGFYPENIKLNIANGDLKYNLLKCTITISQGGKDIETLTVNSDNIDGKLLKHDKLSGTKVTFNIEEIQDPNSKQKHNLNRKMVVNFIKELEVKPNPNFAILFNKSANHTKFGINPDVVKTVEILASEKVKESSGTIYHMVGQKPTRQTNFKDVAELEKILASYIKDKTVENGHRIMIDLKQGGRSNVTNIQIKK
jgi:hypothetical protein